MFQLDVRSTVHLHEATQVLIAAWVVGGQSPAATPLQLRNHDPVHRRREGIVVTEMEGYVAVASDHTLIVRCGRPIRGGELQTHLIAINVKRLRSARLAFFSGL